MSGEYENVRRIRYGGEDGPQFIPVCPSCGQFVKADETMMLNADYDFRRGVANATCKKHGRIQMLFEGFV